MLVGFPSGLDTTEEDGVGTSGGTNSELIKSDGLTASGDDALTRTTGESEGSDGELGDLNQADVIGDSSNLDDDLGLAVSGVCGLLDDS